MRVVKLALISFVVFFVLLTAISMLLPSTVIVSRAANFTGSKDSVYAKVADFSQWKNWIAGIDTSGMEVTNNGTVLQFKGSKVTLVKRNNETIETVWQTGEGTPMKGEFNFITQPNASHFTLQWAFTQKIKWYPWEKFASIVSDKALGPFMEKSLDILKLTTEQQLR
ncbi:MAG: hypothetical protein JWQ96_2775 [Segetibacter sp.]|nr:hypothetical protein [Segetibacter sp.]